MGESFRKFDWITPCEIYCYLFNDQHWWRMNGESRLAIREAIHTCANKHCDRDMPDAISKVIADYLPCHVCEGAGDTSYALKILWKSVYEQHRTRKHRIRAKRA